MAAERLSGSPNPLDSIDVSSHLAHQGLSAVKDEEWRAMKVTIDALYAFREPDGRDPSKPFHRKVNKRSLPDYYDVIKEPVALSTLKAKLNTREYKNFAEFVRDCALIVHNAQTYNRPEAGAYQDALVIKGVMESELQKLVDRNIISSQVAVLPDLGEIPPASPRPLEDEEDDEEDDDDDEDEDDDIDDSDDDGGRRKRKRGPRLGVAVAKREGGSKDDAGQKGNDSDPRKRRGRPPKVDTPMEARIKTVLKGMRKHKNDLGQIMIHHFEKLPDKAAMPEYYVEIKDPMSVELIKRKQKRKKYQSVDHFMRDIDLMLGNAKMYNQDESQIYKDAVHLQAEAHKLADQEKRKPDTDYVMEEGRLPLPNGILNNGELWKVGDWVHIQNPNDVTKPIVAQIYRTWQDAEGQKWVNACWYYRPEQTVHQYEKHFYPNEVVKTGQYRDHLVDEIADRCFVMFFTRYNRGRPRGFPANKEVYVCEARYNEEKHKLNKIKTWASCLPDEVREKDYEMDLFDGVKKVKKIPSPIVHLLKEDAKESDELPKPRWGADNAPPIVGAVYKGPKDENQSPPPEPTPSPPPQQPPQPTRQISSMSNQEPGTHDRTIDIDGAPGISSHVSMPSLASIPRRASQSSYNQNQIQQYHQYSTLPTTHQYGAQVSTYTPQTQHGSLTPSHSSHLNQNSHHQNAYGYQHAGLRSNLTGSSHYNAPRPTEVYHLSDSANSSIPEDIRQQFQCDEQGRILFFTTPPLDTLPPMKHGEALGHSAEHLAAKARREEALKEKRKHEAVAKLEENKRSKKFKHAEDKAVMEEVKQLTADALHVWKGQTDGCTELIYRNLYGDAWEQVMNQEMESLKQVQSQMKQKNSAIEKRAEMARERQRHLIKGDGIYLDDVDPRA